MQPGATPATSPLGPEERRRIGGVDVAFGLTVLVAFAIYFHLTRGTFFFADDWAYAERGRTLTDFFRPYNGHLSVVVLAVYRLDYSILGFRTYVALRIVGLLCLVGVSVAVFVLFRRCTGPLFAAAVAIPVLWFRGATLEPGALNHYLALVGGIAVVGALQRDDGRGDLLVATALTFALCSSGVGVAFAAGAVVHAICTRPAPRRFAAILIPSAAWGVWWLALGRGDTGGLGGGRVGSPSMVSTLWDGLRASVDGLVLGNRVLGVLVALVVVANLGWRLRGGFRPAANSVAWTAALVFWWLALNFSRGELAIASTFRYQLVGAVLALLTLLPPSVVARPTRQKPVLAALTVVALGALVGWAGYGPTYRHATFQRGLARATMQEAIVANLGPTVVPDSQRFDLGLGFLTAREYRGVVGRYGTAAGTTPASVDAALVRLGLKVSRTHTQTRPCAATNGSLTAPPASVVLVEAGSRAAEISIRRFGTQPQYLGRLPARTTGSLRLIPMASTRGWVVSVTHGCLALS